MKADNTAPIKTRNKPIIFTYEPVKVNKTSTTYQLVNTQRIRQPQPDDKFTELIRLEVDQGFSKAKCDYWFRLRDKSNWSKCTRLSGLFRTIKPNIFYGDIRVGRNLKTLLIFIFDDNRNLIIYKFKKGSYPTKKQLDALIESIE